MSTNAACALALLAAWARGDVAAVSALVAPDAVVAMPFGPERRTGMAGLLAGVRDMAAAGVHWEVLDLDASVALGPDRAATHYTSRYTAAGDFVTLPSVLVSTWEGGRLVEGRFYEDDGRLKELLAHDRVQLTRAFVAAAVAKNDLAALAAELCVPPSTAHTTPWGARATPGVGLDGLDFEGAGVTYSDFTVYSCASLGNLRTSIDSSFRLCNQRGQTLLVKLTNVLTWHGARPKTVEGMLDTAAVRQFVADALTDLTQLHRDHWEAVRAFNSAGVQRIFSDATVVAAIAGVPWGAEQVGRNALGQRVRALARCGVTMDSCILQSVTVLGTSNRTIDCFSARFRNRFAHGAGSLTLAVSSTWTWAADGRLAQYEEFFDTARVTRFLLGDDGD